MSLNEDVFEQILRMLEQKTLNKMSKTRTPGLLNGKLGASIKRRTIR
jgi:hypothetical protein